MSIMGVIALNNKIANTILARGQAQMGPLERALNDKLQSVFAPEVLEITNQSHLHSGHGGVKDFKDKMGAGFEGPIESHFNVKIVSAKFDGVSRLARQRMVLDLLAEEMKIIHALSLKALAPNEV